MIDMKQVVADATKWRKTFHQHPELGYTEHQTAQKVASLLTEFGLEVHTGIGITGVVGTLTNGEGPTIGLRADMDALPIQELGSPAYKSQQNGCMHACGHDGHTAMLLGAARYLAQYKPFAGTVHFVFQPAEENLGGAQKMIDDGLFKRFPMEAIYGLHNWPGLPAGDIAVNEGAMMASLDTFEITITGKGSHAAMPHMGVDPIVAAADLVLRLQNIISRHISPLESAVVSITMFNSGEAINVLPESATLKGTVRCLNKQVREQVEQLIAQYVDSADQAPGIRAELSFTHGYPVTTNHSKNAVIIADLAQQRRGEARTHINIQPSMASEDFAFMLDHCPGAYFWLGVDEGESVALHNPYYDFNDKVIEVAIQFWCELVKQQLPVTSL
ncbi:putative hydrolase YxeP [Marinomonas spartinae]|uniref:Putative hydrolase YxeP n=1 Tax=Marinomonas spartinae TaxID=1792290 RepID=A0A1A8T288_9GAMM|nr:M20 aminoacylase family protein [Marinomonas spartinae]SBS25811.1 putative hydrolase YxeP [Marinomonas spartinae]SBS39769.1 putative hydrolase YxeP [Marinomonas spartinae]